MDELPDVFTCDGCGNQHTQQNWKADDYLLCPTCAAVYERAWGTAEWFYARASQGGDADRGNEEEYRIWCGPAD